MIKKIRSFFKKNFLLTASLMFLVVFSGTMQLFAADPPPPVGGYPAGTVLDPGCTPGSVDCIVKGGWLLSGNAGTTSGTDFIGTTDAQDLVFKTNNTEVMKIWEGGLYAGVDIGNPYGRGELDIFGSGDAWNWAGIQLRDNPDYNSANLWNISFSKSDSGLEFAFKDSLGGQLTAMKILPDGGLKFNSISYYWPGSQGYFGDVLINDGSGNLSWGVPAGAFTLDGNSNMFAGTGAGSSLSGGQYNFFAGIGAGQNTTTGLVNTANGINALYNNTTGVANTANGFHSLYSNITGSENTANGYQALLSNTTGSSSVANGFGALYSNTTGVGNTANGYNALLSNTTGFQNTAIGYQALITNTTGTYNTTIGSNADVLSNNLTNATAIGYNAKVGASNSMVLGGTGIDAIKVGIGTTTPSNVLDVVGASGDTTVMSISTTGGNTCTFNTGVNPGVWSCASDRRLKNSISAIDNNLALTKINALNPVMFHYNWQESSDPLVPGFIAQEFEEIFPDMVSTNPETGYKSLSYTPLIPYTVKAIQELDLKVEDLIIEKQNLFSNLISWFGNVGNGIGDFFANRIRTKEICVSDESGETCITKSQLDQILSVSGTTASEPFVTPEIISDPEVPTCEELGNCPVLEPESDLGNIEGEVVVGEENFGEVTVDAGVLVVE